jgi:hypothetical protein
MALLTESPVLGVSKHEPAENQQPLGKERAH